MNKSGTGTGTGTSKKILYSRVEAAELLSITTRYLYTLEKKGLIRAKRTAGRVLFSFKELERFANGEEPESKSGNTSGNTSGVQAA